MRKIHKKSILSLFTFVICLICLFQNIKVTYADNSSKYLILVQQKNGAWKRYENIVEKSSGGNLMIKAKQISKALGLKYKKYSNGTFIIKRSSTRYNTYTKNNKSFIYTNGTLSTDKSAPEIAYTSKLSNYNVCQVSTLNTLVNYGYFDGEKTGDYAKYNGVICYSKYNEIPAAIPESKPVPTKVPTPTPEPEPKMLSIEGIEFPIRKVFLSTKETLSDWGGSAITWGKLEQALDSKIIPSTNLIIGSDTIAFSHLGAGSDGVYLTKAGKGYKLSVSVKLAGSVLADQNASIVKAMVATISAKPSIVYTAIYESFTTNETHGINEDNYISIGDCQVMVEMKKGTVTYFIKEAT